MNLYLLELRKKLGQSLTWSQAGKELSPRMIAVGLLLCVVLALSLRLFTWHVEPVVSRDGVFYIQEAQKLYNSGSALAYEETYGEKLQHPFFLSILASNLLGLTPYATAMIMNLVLGALFPVVIFLISKKLYIKDEIALAGAIIVAVHPTLINYSIEVQREMPFLFFAGLFFFFFFSLLNKKKWYDDIGMAFAAILATGFRYEGGELFFFAVICYAIIFFRSKAKKLKALFHFLIFGSTLVFCALAIYLLFPDYVKGWQKYLLFRVKNNIDTIQGL